MRYQLKSFTLFLNKICSFYSFFAIFLKKTCKISKIANPLFIRISQRGLLNRYQPINICFIFVHLYHFLFYIFLLLKCAVLVNFSRSISSSKYEQISESVSFYNNSIIKRELIMICKFYLFIINIIFPFIFF